MAVLANTLDSIRLLELCTDRISASCGGTQYKSDSQNAERHRSTKLRAKENVLAYEITDIRGLNEFPRQPGHDPYN